MPLLDDDSNAVGCVQVESHINGNYMPSFMIIDFSTHKLRLYPKEAEFATDLSGYEIQNEINCQYITKVNAASARPKVLNCLEIQTTTRSYVVSVDSSDERDDWIEAIRKASMRQSSRPQLPNAQKSAASTGYETKVVGGVIQKTPITASNGERVTEGAEGKGTDEVKVRRRGFPRIIKAGHGIKLGAVMKNWKRRFFVLTEISFSYYKSLEEVEPIKSVAVGEVTAVSQGSKELPGKEHLFEIVTPNRTFFVQVDSNEEMEDWVRAFDDLLQSIKPTLQKHGQASSPKAEVSSNSSDEPITAV